MTDDPTEFIRASREICDTATPGPWVAREARFAVGEADIEMNGGEYLTYSDGGRMNMTDAAFIAHARTALPRALDMLEAQQREAEKWRDARDELARARRRDIDKLERQMDVVAEQLVVALRDGDALRKQLAEQQAEIARLRKCPSCTDGTMMFNIGYFPDGGEIMGRDVCAECEGTMVGAHARKDKP